MRNAKTILILGGARSGKSVFAEELIDETSLAKVYLATGQVFDDEMRRRVGSHQNRRGPEWALREEPVNIAAALSEICNEDTAVLVDCLTLWVTNLMMAEREILPKPLCGMTEKRHNQKIILNRLNLYQIQFLLALVFL